MYYFFFISIAAAPITQFVDYQLPPKPFSLPSILLTDTLGHFLKTLVITKLPCSDYSIAFILKYEFLSCS